ncbi:hypothetical protein NWF32_15845 [Pseudomonas qingdaonensis]|nr:hypothetical protein [Pseudomonas qingdaonensis]
MSLSPQRVNLGELVESVGQVFEALARQKDLSLSLVIDESACRDVLLDPLRFKQILSNLVSNAIKFTDQGQVRVDLALQPGPGPIPCNCCSRSATAVSASARPTSSTCSSPSPRSPPTARWHAAAPAWAWSSAAACAP